MTASLLQVSAHHTVRVSKQAGRVIREDDLRRQIEIILTAVRTRARAELGWTIELGEIVNHRGRPSWYYDEHDPYAVGRTPHIFHVNLAVSCKASRPPQALDAEFAGIVNATRQRGKRHEWLVTIVDDQAVEAEPAEGAAEPAPNGSVEIGYAPLVIPATWGDEFRHLYNLEPHVRRVRAALEAAIRSNWQQRFSVALIGPPGCGKTDLAQSVKRAVGGDAAVLEFDGTSTTMVGAQERISEYETFLPRVMIVEEIEKAQEASLDWMLSVMDMRGEVRRVRSKNSILREAKMLCIATVNNYERFCEIRSGALRSRFASNEIFFERPKREVLQAILEREIARLPEGAQNFEWITPTLDYCEKHQITDPRHVIGICMCGADGLLGQGTYLDDLARTAAPDEFWHGEGGK